MPPEAVNDASINGARNPVKVADDFYSGNATLLLWLLRPRRVHAANPRASPPPTE